MFTMEDKIYFLAAKLLVAAVERERKRDAENISAREEEKKRYAKLQT